MTTTADPAIEAFLGRVRELLASGPNWATSPAVRGRRLESSIDEVRCHRRKRDDPARALAYLAAEAIRQGAAEEPGKGVGE
jgi:hypothetical protein